ncbi:DUF6489 family protein [Emcibacter sp.]|uniref:DUF6489 family protein n=1 Tax=Emcibacter sp. TaxID=1979954 RepID=UPI002AA5EF12|nr:DUF6489 family protein [Emcibacter sp.]
MKISIDIDCTPKEARQFLGLPDLEPIQQAFMAELQEKMTSGLSSEDMEKMFNMWVTPSLNMAGQGLETFQNIFWNAGGKSSGK